ncbi:extracellular solute-binding protein [Halohasta salina]|uniref:extracellular solute-binding protein n=1 Tax=Halohasta salina TaxID=2961621 RepID=UPI0020A2D4D3|nr:extracellular solute-binding protein [Halohasta salina]
MVTRRTTKTGSRRALLTAIGASALGAVAGCLGGSGNEDSVEVLSAGSLARTFEDHLGPAFEADTGISIHGEYYGTNAVMRMVTDRTKHPDVIVSADATLLRDRLYPEFTDWDVEFAANSLGIGYNADTEFGQRLDAGEPWYELARGTDDGDLAISDPELDPLGYRAIQAFKLAAGEHGLDGFREAMADRVYEEPEEPQLLAGVETGSRVGSVVYRNMAVDHDLPFFEFPAAYNFAAPERAEAYAEATYTFEDGETIEGRPILYNLTVNPEADNLEGGQRLGQYIVDHPEILEAAGLTVGEAFPRANGEVPEAIAL